MGIVDAVILLVIIGFGALGLKRGFFNETISFVGFILVVILSFMLKNKLSIILYENLPFFSFGGIFKGVTAINIILYEVLAFIIVFIILLILLKIITFITKVIEKILKATVILAIPSKILGAVIGLIEGFIIVFIGLYILNLPIFDAKILSNSKYKTAILDKTPILSNYVSYSGDVIKEFTDLKDKYDKAPNAKAFNYETLDLFLKYDIVTVDSVKKLDERGKIKVNDLDTLLNKYLIS